MRAKRAVPRTGSAPLRSALAGHGDTWSSPGSGLTFPNSYKSSKSLNGTIMTFVISLRTSAGVQLVPHRLSPFAVTDLPVVELFIGLTMS